GDRLLRQPGGEAGRGPLPRTRGAGRRAGRPPRARLDGLLTDGRRRKEQRNDDGKRAIGAARQGRRQARARLVGRGRAAALGRGADAEEGDGAVQLMAPSARTLAAAARLPIWSQAAARIVERPVERRGDPRAVGARASDSDLVVAEEPLEIRIAGKSLMVTMRTPGDDLDLAAGLLFTEGVVASLDDVAALAHGGAGRDRENVVEVTAARGRALRAAAARRVLRATAACG